MADIKPVFAEISVGELIDKITILQIRTERINDAAKLANINYELGVLESVLERDIGDLAQLPKLQRALKAVNERIWVLEDDIRECERLGEFGDKFVTCARAIYRANDERATLKKQLNEAAGSSIVEEKSYR